jgi:hypothetical protein
MYHWQYVEPYTMLLYLDFLCKSTLDTKAIQIYNNILYRIAEACQIYSILSMLPLKGHIR